MMEETKCVFTKVILFEYGEFSKRMELFWFHRAARIRTYGSQPMFFQKNLLADV